jgi:rare lipoprotein A
LSFRNLIAKSTKIKILLVNFVFATTSLLTSCNTTTTPEAANIQIQDSAPTKQIDVSKIKDAVPKKEAKSQYGNPSYYTVNGQRYYVLTTASGYDKKGTASWYGSKFHGQLTSTREPYDMFAMTAASPELPLPTYVQVTNLKNGKKVIVKVNDRGPFEKGRVIDLSYAAAKKLGYTDAGTAQVQVKVIDPDLWYAHNTKKAIYIQAGVFASLDNALTFEKHLKTLTTAKIKINKDKKPGKSSVYKVQIGPIADVAKSDELAKVLTKNGINAIAVVG